MLHLLTRGASSVLLFCSSNPRLPAVISPPELPSFLARPNSGLVDHKIFLLARLHFSLNINIQTSSGFSEDRIAQVCCRRHTISFVLIYGGKRAPIGLLPRPQIIVPFRLQVLLLDSLRLKTSVIFPVFVFSSASMPTFFTSTSLPSPLPAFFT